MYWKQPVPHFQQEKLIADFREISVDLRTILTMG